MLWKCGTFQKWWSSSPKRSNRQPVLRTMLQPAYFEVDVSDVRDRVMGYVKTYHTFAFFDSHGHPHGTAAHHGNRYAFVAMAGVVEEVKADINALNALQEFISKHQRSLNWIGCAISYDLKNELEDVVSTGSAPITFPMVHGFVPEVVFSVDETGLLCVHSAHKDPEEVFSELMATDRMAYLHSEGFRPIQKIDQESYRVAFDSVLRHLQRGDIYEATLCQQIVARFDSCDPASLFKQLCTYSPNPFSVLYQNDDKAVVCASPERFLQHDYEQLVSQPMKGTARRSPVQEEDTQIKEALAQSSKERSENVMIVDLVRNDLSKVAARGSVEVKELFGVQTFAASHQMVSTIACELKPDVNLKDVLKATFPMGSMTGAPKISAMKIIDHLEEFKRGLFSGSIGFFAPGGYYDLNVVIRAICLDLNKNIATITAGGAITIHCNMESEWQECLMKLKPQLLATGIQVEEATA